MADPIPEARLVTRDTRGVSTGLTPGESQEYPEVPGYEILGVLGHGGMGVVYRARQLKANRLVALKMIRALDHATPQDRMRFQIETEAIARLQHPNIVQLHEVGEVRNQPFFSLEFCDGGTLTDQLKKKRPTPREAAELIETLARAMHYAHLRGVVHRDLKPGNVLLSEHAAPASAALAGAACSKDHVPKITDFGLAKRIDDEARDVSKSGAIMGTASYMAPEQAAGKVRDTGPAADVYGLGALLYECLTGRPPFEGPQHVVLVGVLHDEPVAPSRLISGLPRDLETICLKCLHKVPESRYANAEALAEDLRRFQAGEPIAARPAGRLERAAKWARRRPALAGLLGVIVLALAALSVLSGYLVKLATTAENEKTEAVKQKGIAEGKEAEALKQAEKATRARDFLVNIFRISEKNTQSGNMTARQILDKAEREIPRDFEKQPDLRDELLASIKDVKRGIDRTIPLAMILEMKGTVALRSFDGLTKVVKAQVLLQGDDHLTLGADAHVKVVVLSDLHQEQLLPGREITIGRQGCEPTDAVKRSDDLLMTFVHLPAATFYMGWDGKEIGKKTEIEKDFYIAVHDVTQGQWEAVMGTNPSWCSRKGGGRGDVLDISDEELKLFPVENVSWNDAQEFIKKLNEKKRGSGYVYRLPTEAEWEYACRGGATSEEECSYHFYFDKPTNELSAAQANCNGNFPFGNAPKGKYLERTSRVGAYPSNKLGLCDMHGNVWQWCSDELDGGGARPLRGGCWLVDGRFCLAAYRHRDAPSSRDDSEGLRLARVPVE